MKLNSFKTITFHLVLYGVAGLPLGFLMIAMPDWLRSHHFTLRQIGLFSWIQIPILLRFLVAPTMEYLTQNRNDRWKVWTHAGLGSTLMLTVVLGLSLERSQSLFIVWFMACLLACSSTVIDIAANAWFVEQAALADIGWEASLRNAAHRVGQGLSGGLVILLSTAVGTGTLEISLASLYLLPWMFWRWSYKSKQEKALDAIAVQKTTFGFLKEACLDIDFSKNGRRFLLFVAIFRFGDGMAAAFIRPFLIDLGYGPFDRGITLAVGALGLGIAGTALGSYWIKKKGLELSIWIAAIAQLISNFGYVWISYGPPRTTQMFVAVALENLCGGFATAVFLAVIFERINPRFAAVQTALYLCLSGILSAAAGPILGAWVDLWGWTTFMLLSVVASIPAMWVTLNFKNRIK